MNPRDTPAQQPPDAIDSGFPSIAPGRSSWFRAHTYRSESVDGGCWYYASSPAMGQGGRFDLPQPHGTCYWASSEIAAARERLGRAGDLIAYDEVRGSVVSTAWFDPGVLADLLSTDAAKKGVTGELGNVSSYALGQLWARAFFKAGFSGIHYQPRFSTERVEALALFSFSGTSHVSDHVQQSKPMMDVLASHGYTILPQPQSCELRVLFE